MIVRWSAAILCAVLLGGCGRSDGQLPVAPVRGTVLLDGKPLTSGVVTIWPKAGRVACGQVQPDGTFELTTYASGDGAQLGTHPVTVTRVAPVGERELTPAELMQIPLIYGSPESSGLSVEVSADQPNDFVLELRRK